MKKIILSIVLLVSGCVQATVSEEQVCEPRPLTVPGVLLAGNYTVPVSYHVDIHDLDILDTMHFLGGSLDGSSLSNVDNVALDVNGLTLFSSVNSGATSINVPASPRNLADLVNGSGTGFDVTVTLSGVASGPMSDWVLDTNFCFDGGIDRSYGL